MPSDELDFLCSRDVAGILKISVSTLAKWRQRGAGPAFTRVGERIVRYRREDVRIWLSRRNKPH